MKVTIGDRYHRQGDSYVEQLKILGVDGIDDNIPHGETVVPRDGDSHLKVEVINDITYKPFQTTIKVRHLATRWKEGTYADRGLRP